MRGVARPRRGNKKRGHGNSPEGSQQDSWTDQRGSSWPLASNLTRLGPGQVGPAVRSARLWPRGIQRGIPGGAPTGGSPGRSPRAIFLGDPPGGSPLGDSHGDPPEGSPWGPPWGIPEGYPPGVSKGYPPGGSPREIPLGDPPGVSPWGIPQGIPPGIFQGHPWGIPQGWPGWIAQQAVLPGWAYFWMYLVGSMADCLVGVAGLCPTVSVSGEGVPHS